MLTDPPPRPIKQRLHQQLFPRKTTPATTQERLKQPEMKEPRVRNKMQASLTVQRPTQY